MQWWPSVRFKYRYLIEKINFYSIFCPVFEQGDEGQCWYIILRGSVDVVIHGKGAVAVLQEGDDFGKLALVNESPRAATIVLRENNCHFLRVDKQHFNRILRDVEANTVSWLFSFSRSLCKLP